MGRYVTRTCHGPVYICPRGEQNPQKKYIHKCTRCITFNNEQDVQRGVQECTKCSNIQQGAATKCPSLHWAARVFTTAVEMSKFPVNWLQNRKHWGGMKTFAHQKYGQPRSSLRLPAWPMVNSMVSWRLTLAKALLIFVTTVTTFLSQCVLFSTQKAYFCQILAILSWIYANFVYFLQIAVVYQ